MEGIIKSTQNMGKGLHKLFKTIANEISQNLPPLGEYGSEVSYFIPKPRNFSEVTRLSDDIKKLCLKATQNEIKNLIMQSDGSLDELKSRIVIRGDMKKQELVGDTWSPTASMRNLKYFLADAAKNKARVRQLDCIGLVLAQDGLFALILWYVAKYLS